MAQHKAMLDSIDNVDEVIPQHDRGVSFKLRVSDVKDVWTTMEDSDTFAPVEAGDNYVGVRLKATEVGN